MPERSSALQHVQIGIETNEGVSTAANKQLQALSLTLKPEIETNRFMPVGTLLDTLVTPGKEWTSGGVSGIATYDEILYALASVLVTPAAPVTSGTTGKLWTFEPSAVSEDTVTTYTVEQGSAIRAQKATGCVLTDFSIKWDRSVIEIGGALLGQLFSDGITMTATPTSVPLVPILPKDISVYDDTTAAGLGTTKPLRVLSGEFGIGGRFNPLWVLNQANASYAGRTLAAPDVSLKLLVEADAAGMAYLAAVRAGTTRFLRFEAVGGVIGAGPAVYKYTHDMAMKVESIDSLDDSDGVYALSVNLRGVYDATWAKWLSIKIVNSTTAL